VARTFIALNALIVKPADPVESLCPNFTPTAVKNVVGREIKISQLKSFPPNIAMTIFSFTQNISTHGTPVAAWKTQPRIVI
jgi:hypothetical protein